MTAEKHAAKVARQHTVYKLADGTRVPGVTTITGVMDKKALVKWANRIGLEGIEVDKYVDELAAIGTLAHYLIECYCTGEKPELDQYSKAQVGLAENSVIKWLYWQESTGFVPEHNELALISEVYRVGGTIDIIGRLTKQNNKRVLVDIKTCKGIYGEHKTQVAGGYGIIAREHRSEIGDIEGVIITRVGRNPDEGFEEVVITDGERIVHEQRFAICRELYAINQAIEKGAEYSPITIQYKADRFLANDDNY
jgi:hypothetical protein